MEYVIKIFLWSNPPLKTKDVIYLQKMCHLFFTRPNRQFLGSDNIHDVINIHVAEPYYHRQQFLIFFFVKSLKNQFFPVYLISLRRPCVYVQNAFCSLQLQLICVSSIGGSRCGVHKSIFWTLLFTAQKKVAQ